MKTVNLTIEETLKFKRNMIIEVPYNTTLAEFARLIFEVERDSKLSADVSLVMKDLNNKINILENPDEALSSPSHSEIEIIKTDF